MTISDAIHEGVARGYDARQLVAYLELVNWHEPGSAEYRDWQKQRRRLAGRLRRHKAAYCELVRQLPFGGE